MNIYIYGAGLFGTAIGNELAKNEHNNVVLITRDESQANEVNNLNTNYKYFPNKTLNKRLHAKSSLTDLKEADLLFIALPSSKIEESAKIIKRYSRPDLLIVNLSKGILSNGETITSYLTTNLESENIVTMKGPTFATELINGSHSMFTLGFSTKRQYDIIKQITTKTNIHFDYTKDIQGVEILSVLKNIYAILIGIIDAKYNSANTRFMILTKAFSEISIFLNELGGKKDTLLLSCGFGDMGLTSLNDLSRNRTLGLLIGKGFYNPQTKGNSVVLEGLKTLKHINHLMPDYLLDRLPLFNSLNTFFESKEKTFSVDFDALLNKKMRTVLTYGTFDLLHYGHLEILRRSKALGDRLIVGVSTDDFNRIKGKECKINFEKRKEFLEALEYVDVVIPEDQWDQKVNDIVDYDVDIFVMGDDWKGKFDDLKKYCKVVYLPRTPGISTTKLKSIIKNL